MTPVFAFIVVHYSSGNVDFTMLSMWRMWLISGCHGDCKFLIALTAVTTLTVEEIRKRQQKDRS